MSVNTPNFYAIIPAHVRYCKELEHGAKLLYGELTALSSQEGYCWATNKYLASLYDVDERTITRWLGSLKALKFIILEVTTGGYQTIRKIWISPEVKKVSTTTQKCRGVEKITVTPDDKNVLHINTEINTKEKEREGDEPPPPPLFTYKRVKFELQKLYVLEQEFGKEKIHEMLERLDEYADINPKRFKQYADHATVVRKWLREDKTKVAAKSSLKDAEAIKQQAFDETITKHREAANALQKKLWKPGKASQIYVGNEYIELCSGDANKRTIRIEYASKFFLERLESALVSLGLYHPSSKDRKSS